MDSQSAASCPRHLQRSPWPVTKGAVSDAPSGFESGLCLSLASAMARWTQVAANEGLSAGYRHVLWGPTPDRTQRLSEPRQKEKVINMD